MHRSGYALLFVFAFGCQCGNDPLPIEGDPDCLACSQDGEACNFTINCNPGRICNTTRDPLFDPNAPFGVCISLECDSDAECDAPRVCTLERICRPPVCQGDVDCANGEVCVGGECGVAPSAQRADRCVIVSPHTSLRFGDSTPLHAIALEGDRVIPRAAFDFVSSDPGIVSVSGSVATAGTRAGMVEIRATVRDAPSVMCRGVSVQTFEPVAAGRVRVVAVDATDGAPLEGAAISIFADAAASDTTDTFGRVEATVTGTITSITVVKDGWRTVSVIAPGANDVLVPVPRAPDLTTAGGIRGGVVLDALPLADVQAALVYNARAPDLLDYRALPSVDIVSTRLNAPQFDLDQTSDLPGNFVAGLGTNEFTRDVTRCRSGGEPGLGCFLTRTSEGYTAAWVMGGEYKLSALTSLANELSEFQRPDPYTARDRAELIRLFTPLTQGGWMGAVPFVEVEATPKVRRVADSDCTDPFVAITDRCRPDFDAYVEVDAALSHRAALTTEVVVPRLPDVPGGGCAGTMIAASYAVLEGRGLVLTGLGGGDDLGDPNGADCIVASDSAGFGYLSRPIPRGSVALTTTPLHSGMEGSDQVLVLSAIDTSERPARPLDLTLIAAPIDRYDRKVDLAARAFLPFPSADVDKANARISNTSAPGATGVRVAIESLEGGWYIYLPADTETVQLPDVPAARRALTRAAFMTLQAFEVEGAYEALWAIEAPDRMDRVKTAVRAVTTTQCEGDGRCLTE